MWRTGLTAKRASGRRGHRLLKWIGGSVLATLAVVAGVVLVLAHRAEPMLRARIVQELSDHFHARVELDSFHVELRDGVWAEGKGLRIWPPADVIGVAVPGTVPSVAPLIRLGEFRFHTPLRYKPGEAIRISVIQLKGLEIDVPPRPHFDHSPAEKLATGNAESKPGATTGLRFEVEGVNCTGAHLTIETSKPGKLPLEFAIAHLRLSGIKSGRSMGYEAELTNPKPVGTIHTSGSFGPWVVADPGESPVTGEYKFEHADLGGFKGIAGILSSVGHYGGTLRELTVDGETDTPDFQLTHFGTTMALHTNFHARVDGTNGDTWLEPVEATLGGSHFWARGRVVRVAPAADGKSGSDGGVGGGHDIAMKIDVDRARVEDFLRLASRSGSPMLTGDLVTKAEFDISPGQVPVEQRLKLAGTFSLNDVQFTSDKVQLKIAELSARGQGHPKDAKNGNQADVRSTMDGTFKMGSGVVTLQALKYTVPGAVIDLTGKYGVEGGTLDFVGTAKMDAKVSEMVGGWKGLLLKTVDHYFQKDGAGTEVPIHINGTRENPQFGVDIKGMKGTSAQRPDEVKEPTHPQQPGASQNQPQ